MSVFNDLKALFTGSSAPAAAAPKTSVVPFKLTMPDGEAIKASLTVAKATRTTLQDKDIMRIIKESGCANMKVITVENFHKYLDMKLRDLSVDEGDRKFYKDHLSSLLREYNSPPRSRAPSDEANHKIAAVTSAATSTATVTTSTTTPLSPTGTALMGVTVNMALVHAALNATNRHRRAASLDDSAINAYRDRPIPPPKPNIERSSLPTINVTVVPPTANAKAGANGHHFNSAAGLLMVPGSHAHPNHPPIRPSSAKPSGTLSIRPRSHSDNERPVQSVRASFRGVKIAPPVTRAATNK